VQGLVEWHDNDLMTICIVWMVMIFGRNLLMFIIYNPACLILNAKNI
jgi:hypothetical protein